MIFARSTLSMYFGKRFLQAVFGMFFAVFVLVYMLDFVELLRRAGDARNSATGTLARLALFRTPSVTEQIIPFAVLFGSMAAFLNLSRRLELVVARAAGISAWQFLLPAFLAAIAIGFLTMMAFNPLAANLKREADRLEARVFQRSGGVGTSETGTWFRQRSIDGEAILRAETVIEKGGALSTVTAFVFDQTGQQIERIEAPTADLKDGYWQFTNAWVLPVGAEPQTFETYLLATSLTQSQISESFTPTDTVSFWELNGLAAQLELAGLNATRYRLRYESLAARPLLFLAMVLVAASVSLRFFRFGGVARLVLTGVIAGFMLYVATAIAADLGSAGVLGARAAAWAPAAFGSLAGIWALLKLEDG